MINTTPASEAEGSTTGRHLENAAFDHIVDLTGTVPIGFGTTPSSRRRLSGSGRACSLGSRSGSR